MKRKKLLQKVLSAALAASMVMSLTACGGSSNSTGSNASGSDSTQTTAASTEKADATAATETKEETKERQTVTFMTIDFNAGTSNTDSVEIYHPFDFTDFRGCYGLLRYERSTA